MKRKYESDIIQMCHEEALALHKLGAISDERMGEFDEMAFGAEDPAPETQTPNTVGNASMRQHAPVYAASR